LRYHEQGQNIVIEDGRNGSPRTFQYDGLAARLYDFLQDSRSSVVIKKEFGENGIEPILSEFLDADLIAFLDGRYLALALDAGSA
jgi:hypothetical protein